MNKEQAMTLRYGDELHFGECTEKIGPRGGKTRYTMTWRVTGKCRTWKTRLKQFRVPLKHGLYAYDAMDETNAEHFHLASECPPQKADKSP